MKRINLTLFIVLGFVTLVSAQFPLAEIEGNTFINGKLGIGTDSTFRELTTIGWIRSSSDVSQMSSIEMFHGGVNGFINIAGTGNLDFRKNGLTQMSMTGTGNFGIGESSPVEKLEVSGGIRLETASSAMPHEGTIQWNEDTQDFEGYNGTEWLSLTKKCSSTGSMNTGPPVPPMCCEESYTNIDGGESDAFGRSVAIYGNYGSVAQFSAVHLFIFGGNSWMLDTSISVDFQSSTALDTSWALIGNIDLSEIIILQNNSDHWNVYDTLQASDAVIGDDFGWSVGVSGEYLIAGAPRAEFDGDVSRGKVFFFHNISGSWTETAKLPYSEGNANDFLGASVDISGRYAVAGASDHDSYGDMNRGIVVVYELNGNIWGESDTLHMPNGTSLAQFGRSVSIEDDYIVVGAPGAVNSAGNAYIFKRNGSNWELDATLQAPDGVAGDQFGASVSISGDYVIVGAPFHDINGKVDQGAAYIFHYDGTTWNQIEKLTDPVGLAGDRYGNAVATDSANRLVGAPTASANGDIGRGKVIFGPID